MSADATAFREQREYVAIRPTTAPLVPEAAATAFRALHGCGTDLTLEMLLVTAGTADDVTYLFGVDGADRDAVARFCERAFPTEYEQSTVTLSLADALTTDAARLDGASTDAAAHADADVDVDGDSSWATDGDVDTEGGTDGDGDRDATAMAAAGTAGVDAGADGDAVGHVDRGRGGDADTAGDGATAAAEGAGANIAQTADVAAATDANGSADAHTDAHEVVATDTTTDPDTTTDWDTTTNPAATGDAAGGGGRDGAAAGPPLWERSVSALEVQARETWDGDWQTGLRAFDSFAVDGQTQWPLADVIRAVAAAQVPMVVQTLLEPLSDWTPEATETIEAYHWPSSSFVGDIVAEVFGLSSDVPDRQSRTELPEERRQRVAEIEAVNTRQSVRVNTRAVAFGAPTGPDPAAAIAALEGAFTAVGKSCYQLETTAYATDSSGAERLRDALVARTVRGRTWERRLQRALGVSLPFTRATQPVIVADPTAAGAFCLVGGADCPEAVARALAVRPGERTGVPRPPAGVLETFRGPGLQLGYPETGNRTVAGAPIRLPPALQRRHQLFAGMSGAGKSTLGVQGLLPNHAATDGATIIVESKDGAMADAYERAHYKRYGTLDDVYRFDAAERLPAMPFFDVVRHQEAGLPRQQAVEDVTDQTEELLAAIMGAEQYEAAATSSQVIEVLVKSMFDLVHGDDRFTLADLQARARQFADTGHVPPVVDAELRRELHRIADNTEDTFTEIMGAAARRIGEAAIDSRVAPLFNYTPDADASPEPFDWRARLDEDCVVIVDTSDLRQEPQRVVTLTILSQLWTAFRQRDRERAAAGRTAAPPLVNVHIEEAADVADAGVLDELLSKGRSFGVSVTLSLQYPGQLRRADRAAYEEALNNVGTVVTGRVELDDALAERLATHDMPPDAVANRLRGLEAGEWLVKLPPAHGLETARPFVLRSGPQPPGHPDGPQPLTAAERATLAAARTDVVERSRRHAVSVTAAPDVQPDPDVGAGADAGAGAAVTTAGDGPAGDGPAGAGAAAERADTDAASAFARGATTLPHTERFPDCIEYNPAANTIVCPTCDTRHGSTLESLVDAVDCHGSLDELDRAAVPTVDVDLNLDPGEREATGYTDSQLVFLQVVYKAQQLQYDPEWEYDIVHDGMECLRAYAGIADEAFEEMVTDGLLSIDGDTPHTLYTVTSAGRDTIEVAHREGQAHGDGVGDLSESSTHVCMVQTMRRGFEHEFVADGSHPGTAVHTYYGVEDGRLDVAVLDDAGEVVVAGEAERANNDLLRAAPADFDLMAACDPERAIWVVEGRSEGHQVIRALHNAPDGEPRVEKTYSEDYYLPNVIIDEPGFTDIYALGTFRNQWLPGDGR